MPVRKVLPGMNSRAFNSFPASVLSPPGLGNRIVTFLRKDAVMSEPVAQTTAVETPSESDLVAAVRTVLEKSDEPLTLSKIRAALPTRMRSVSLETLAEGLRR